MVVGEGHVCHARQFAETSPPSRRALRSSGVGTVLVACGGGSDLIDAGALAAHSHAQESSAGADGRALKAPQVACWPQTLGPPACSGLAKLAEEGKEFPCRHALRDNNGIFDVLDGRGCSDARPAHFLGVCLRQQVPLAGWALQLGRVTHAARWLVGVLAGYGLLGVLLMGGTLA